MRIRMPISMMRRSRSGGRGPAICGGGGPGGGWGGGGGGAQVREEVWPDVRDADELHDVLHSLVALPQEIGAGVNGRAALAWTAEGGRPPMNLESVQWSGYLERLREEGRAGVATDSGGETAPGQPASRRRYWVAAER